MTITEEGRFDPDEKEAILQYLVGVAADNLGSELDPEERSVLRSFYDPVAEYFASQQEDIANVLDASQLAHAEGEALTLLTQFVGVSRNSANPASTTLRFSRQNPPSAVYSIPEGTQAQTNETSPIVFETEEGASIRLIDDFTDENLVEYEGDTSGTDFNIQSTGGINDSPYLFCQIDDGQLYRKEETISAGSRTHCRVELYDTSVGGIMLGHQDENNHYRFIADETANEIRMVAVEDGTEEVLRTASATEIPPVNWMHFEVDWKIDNTFDFTVKNNSGDVLAEMTVDEEANRYSTGSVGFYSGVANCKYDNLSRAATSVEATATQAGGDTNVAPGTLTVMPDTPSGVESVRNTTQATGGNDRESDDNLRARARTELSDGMRATQKAIINRLDKLNGTRSVSVIANDTGSEDADGRPGHSFEAVVEANETFYEDVAQTILDTKAAGDVAVGGYVAPEINRVAELPNGQTKEISFSRPQPITIYVDVTVQKNSDYLGDDAVRDAIVRYIGGVLTGGGDEDGDLNVSDDVVYNALTKSIMDVRGVHDVTELQIGTSDNPTGTTNIEIKSYEAATTDASDTSVIGVTSNNI